MLITTYKNYKFQSLLAAGLAVITFNSQAATVDLEDWIFNVDGITHEAYFGDALPTSGDLIDGLGTLSLEVSGAGNHNIISFFDFEIDQYSNTFYNESGEAVGTPSLGQSWEIDEPKYFFGDIIDNVLIGMLDNSNAIPSGLEEDVGLALGWDFELLAGQTATIDFVFTDALPSTGFYLNQYDSDSDFSLYFYSTLNISGGAVTHVPVTTVDEPSALLLALAGGLGMLFTRRRKNQDKQIVKI